MNHYLERGEGGVSGTVSPSPSSSLRLLSNSLADGNFTSHRDYHFAGLSLSYMEIITFEKNLFLYPLKQRSNQ